MKKFIKSISCLILTTIFSVGIVNSVLAEKVDFALLQSDDYGVEDARENGTYIINFNNCVDLKMGKTSWGGNMYLCNISPDSNGNLIQFEIDLEKTMNELHFDEKEKELERKRWSANYYALAIRFEYKCDENGNEIEYLGDASGYFYCFEKGSDGKYYATISADLFKDTLLENFPKAKELKENEYIKLDIFPYCIDEPTLPEDSKELWFDRHDGVDPMFRLNDGNSYSINVAIHYNLTGKESVKRPTVSFDTQGGTEKEAVEVDENYRIGDAIIDLPTKDGYEFLYWSDNKQGRNFIIAEPEINAFVEDTTLTANWVDKSILKDQINKYSFEEISVLYPEFRNLEFNKENILKYMDKNKDGVLSKEDYALIEQEYIDNYIIYTEKN